MAHSEVLATAFEDEIVFFDCAHGRLVHLDAWATRVWRTCDGSTLETIAQSARGTTDRVRETLDVLRDAGLVHRTGSVWVRSPVAWV